LRLPQHLYTALQRFDAWIEPALLAEWARLIKGYALRQHRTVDENTLVAALAWSDPARDVTLARGQAMQLLQGGGLQCVYRDRVPSEVMLSGAQTRIQDWWAQAYDGGR
jgi:hypothetical protein